MLRPATTWLFLIAILPACSRGRIALGRAMDEIEDGDDVEDLCDDFRDSVRDTTLEVLFEAPTGTCPWGEDDNLDAENTYLTARIEQVETLELPDAAVICDMDMDLSGLVPGQTQLIVYDDYFFFTFNDNVLASSHRPAVEALTVDDGFPVYSWSEIVGEPFPDGDAPFCLGEDSGDAVCDIPSTEEPGPISLVFDRDVTNELSARAWDEGRFDFGFITVGDNNPASDCQHAAFGFTVDVDYLEQ